MTTIEYVSQVFADQPDDRLQGYLGFDEPYPMNVSRFLWLMSGWSQQTYEASVLAFGRN